MAKVLVVEDDIDLADTMREWLEMEHYTVEVAHAGDAALELLQVYDYDLVVLDWDLPGMSGIEILREFRADARRAPVLMLTGKKSIAEKETGLDAGADDYLTKPFHMRELSARLRALLRRVPQVADNILRAGDIELHPGSFKVMRGGVEIELLPREFALLEFFMRYPDQVFSTEAVLNRVWRSDSDATPEAFRTCLKRLRRKIDTDGGESIIRTVHGVGYRLNR